MSAPDLTTDNEELVQPVASAPSPAPARTPTQKQKINVYTMMLILAFFALVTAVILLYLELATYGPFPMWKPTVQAGISGSPLVAWLPG